MQLQDHLSLQLIEQLLQQHLYLIIIMHTNEISINNILSPCQYIIIFLVICYSISPIVEVIKFKFPSTMTDLLPLLAITVKQYSDTVLRNSIEGDGRGLLGPEMLKVAKNISQFSPYAMFIEHCFENPCG